MNKPPLISVVMPVYNAGAHLDMAVQSILKQDLGNFEFLAIDDGSTDDSLRILRQLAAIDPRLRIIARPNTGIVGALNDGLAAATGEYVARMDADDVALPERFARQVAYLAQHSDCVLVGTRILMIDPDGVPIRTECRLTIHSEIDVANMGGHFAICHPSVMMRRTAIERVGGYRAEFQYAEDLDLWLRLAEVGTIANLPDVLLQYRTHLSSITFNKATLMRNRVAEAIAAARQRRGLPAFQVSSSTEPSYRPPNPAGTSASWALSALEERQYRSAIHLASKAIRRYPRNPRPWVAMVFASLGPMGRLLARSVLRRHYRSSQP